MVEGEENLIRQAQAGSAESFGTLYDHYVPQIYRFVLLKVTAREEAEDLTHEIFLRAWRKIKAYQIRGFPFSSWLYQIARNQVIDHYRLKKNQISLEMVDVDLVKAEESVERDVERLLSLDRVREAMKDLSHDEQDVLIMRFVEGLSHREIASTISKSEGAVRLIQHRALNALRKSLA
jgi:RNA polymerase sigma-70 factor (ECF subfamily)